MQLSKLQENCLIVAIIGDKRCQFSICAQIREMKAIFGNQTEAENEIENL